MKAFDHYHPFVLLVYFLALLLVAMFATNPVLQLLALLGGAAFSVITTKKGERRGDFAFYHFMFFLVAVTNPLFSHNGVTPLFFLNGNPVTLEAFVYGFDIAVAIIGVMLWCKCYSAIITSEKFLYLFGKAIPKLSLILSMALKFVPSFKQQLKRVKNAQKAMGFYSSKSYTDRVKSAVRVFTAMIAWSMENAVETSNSMRARGYGLKGRSHFSLFRFSGRDGALLASCTGLLCCVLAAAAFSKLSFYYYPRISKIPATPGAILAYAAFGILAFLPVLIEVKESLIWKYYISKI